MNATRLGEIRALAEKHAASGKECVRMLLECCIEIEGHQRQRNIKKRQTGAAPASRFTLSQVMAEAERLKWPSGLAEQCYDTYEQIGWVYGKNRHPIVKLPSAMQNWRRHHDKWNPAPNDQKIISGRFGVA